MVTLTNNWIIIDSEDPSILYFTVNLIKNGSKRTFRLKNGRKVTVTEEDVRFYSLDGDGNMYIPIGLYDFFTDVFVKSDIVDNRSIPNWSVDDIICNLNDYRYMLNGIELRDEQLIAIRKAIAIRRGILQLPTGSGKTEILCGIIKAISIVYGKIPTTLILEPTLNLVNSTADRFKKYEIDAVPYNENREIVENCVNICHPSALGNDIDVNPNLLDGVEILLGDESHHFNSEQFRKPTYNMPNLVMSIGVSASAITQEHINYTDLMQYDVKEIRTFSATGKLLVNVVTGNMIDQNRLAKPVLCMMHYECKEPLPNNDVTNWTNISSIRLESDARNKLIADCVRVFTANNRKVLILVNTVRWARKLMAILHGDSISVGASYGSGKFELYDGNNYVSDDNILSKFSSGELGVLIGTTHLYEGADIPNLDVIVLAFSGKGERTQIQGIGRALRLTKTGKYAYIIDFTDDGDVVLHNHSQKRLNRYRTQIGVEKDKMFVDISVDDLKSVFGSLELS